MAGQHIDIVTPNGSCDCYISAPEGDVPYPAILFYMDGIGLRPTLYQMADGLAAQGYYVLLPNTFYRRGRTPLFDPATILDPENVSTLIDLVSSFTPDSILEDAEIFLSFLNEQKAVRAGKIGVVGYCMGGSMVMRTAACFADRVAAGASFHGGQLASDSPDSPHHLAEKINAELYFGHADKDDYMTVEQIGLLNSALDAASVRYQSEIYEGALHGFTMADLPVFDEAACERHWQQLLGLLKRNLPTSYSA